MIDPSAEARLRAATATIWQRTHAEAMRRVEVVESAVMLLLEGALDEESRAAAEREAHKLAGTVGTFGFTRASEIARELELFLAAPARHDAALLRAADLVEKLHASISTATVSGDAELAGDEVADVVSPPRALVVHPSLRRASTIVTALNRHGFTAEPATSLESAQSKRRSRPPAAAVVDLSIAASTDPRAVEDLLAGLERSGTKLVALIASGAAGTAERLRAVRAGAQVLLDRGMDVEAIADAAATLLESTAGRARRVLVVDDDEAVLAVVKRLLHGDSIAVSTLSDAGRFWEEVTGVQPDLILLDVDMPDASGLELCRLLRSDPRWREVPVIFLSGRNDSETITAVFAVGADDFVSKPFVGPELAARVQSRLDRAHLYQLLAETDPLTGVANRRRLERDLTRLQMLADRYDGLLCVAVVDLDHFKALNDRHGHAAGDEVLRRFARHLSESFRGEDLVARLGGEEFVIAMLGLTPNETVERLTEVLTDFQRSGVDIGDGEVVHVGASGGVVDYARDTPDFHHLYRAADTALRAAKASGRGKVLPAAAATTADSTYVDVVIVEDDEVLAELLRHTLQIYGYRCVVIPDGDEALRRLAGTVSDLSAAAVLLDIDLPGRTGFEVLHGLRDGGVTSRTAVLVVTAHADENDAVRALSHGASDFVTKPFSVPVLVEKLRKVTGVQR